MTILWAGGEDADFVNYGGNGIITTAGHFRAGYARCALQVAGVGLSIPQTVYWRAPGLTLSNFWWGARIWSDLYGGYSGGDGTPTNGFLVRFFDASGIVRLRLIAANGSQQLSGNWTVQKVSAAGVATTLATTTSSFSVTTLLQKFDLHIDYAVAGSIDMFIDGNNVLSYSGNVTTDSVTTLGGFDLGQATCAAWANGVLHWSEIIVADTDTRQMGLVTLQPNGAGALSQFTGTASGATINEITLNDTDGIDTGTANNVSLFTQPGILPSNIDYGIQAVIVSARALTVAGQPQHMDLAVRQGSTVYLSADKTITTTFAPYQNIWSTNPDSTVAWTPTDLTTMQIGVKAIA